MADINISFDSWDDTKDILLYRPGSKLGFAAIYNALEVGDMATIKKRREDSLIRESEDGVIGLVAGGIEWLRSRGYSAEDVQSKLRAYKQGNLDRQDQTVLQNKEVRKAITEISNPRNLTLSDKVVLG